MGCPTFNFRKQISLTSTLVVPNFKVFYVYTPNLVDILYRSPMVAVYPMEKLSHQDDETISTISQLKCLEISLKLFRKMISPPQ
jgi:hypothetical protein